MTEFTKVKYDDKERKVILRWQESRKGGRETLKHGLDSKDAPEPEFLHALDALKRHVLGVLELPSTYGIGLTVRGVSINYEDDGRRGVVVTCLKALAETNAPLVLNTPHMREQMEDDEGGAFAPDDLLDALEEVLMRAERYLKGFREQGALNLDPAA